MAVVLNNHHICTHIMYLRRQSYKFENPSLTRVSLAARPPHPRKLVILDGHNGQADQPSPAVSQGPLPLLGFEASGEVVIIWWLVWELGGEYILTIQAIHLVLIMRIPPSGDRVGVAIAIRSRRSEAKIWHSEIWRFAGVLLLSCVSPSCWDPFARQGYRPDELGWHHQRWSEASPTPGNVAVLTSLCALQGKLHACHQNVRSLCLYGVCLGPM